MTEQEYLELLCLSAVLIPNMDPREFNVKLAADRQMELFKKASKKYSYFQEAEEVTTSD